MSRDQRLRRRIDPQHVQLGRSFGTRQTACEGKFPYVDAYTAKQWALKINDGELVNPYKCPFCPAFHIGRPK